MNASEHIGDLLSREELDALLEELASARVQEQQAGQLFPDSGGERGSARALRGLLQEFALREGCTLASRLQRWCSIELLSFEEIRAPELAELLLPLDRALAFGVPGTAEPGFLVFSRPFWYARMRLAFGARPPSSPEPLPDRRPTAIECRFLARAARETLERLSAVLERPLEPRTLVEPGAMGVSRNGRLDVAHFSVSGLEEVGHIRLALPAEVAEPKRDDARTAVGPRGALEGALLDASVRFSAEVGTAEVALRQLAQLSVGDVIALEASRDGLLTARIDGAAKFRAARGSVDQRLAVRLLGRAGSEGDEGDGQLASE